MNAMNIPAADLMSALRSGQSTAPRLTWYGPDAERVELSGRVLDNWVAKTSNLLQDELDAEPGTRLRLDLPAHWKSLVLALAAWQLGMEVVLADGDAELLATADPGPAAAAGGVDAVLAVALPALAMRWPGELPSGVLDYAAEVRSHGDVFMAYVDPEPDRTALRDAAGVDHPHGRLVEDFGAPRGVADDSGADDGDTAPRLLVQAGDGLEAALSRALWAWSRDGSVVLAHQDVALTDRLLGDERITHR